MCTSIESKQKSILLLSDFKHQNQNGYARRYYIYDILWISKAYHKSPDITRDITTEFVFWMYHYPKDYFVRGYSMLFHIWVYALKHVSLNQANHTIFVGTRQKRQNVWLHVRRNQLNLSYLTLLGQTDITTGFLNQIYTHTYQIYHHFITSVSI